MLDHNTTKNVAWNSSGNNADGMKEVATALTNDIATWHTSVKNTARLITGQEVANIIGDTTWTDGGNAIVLTTQSWLYQNLSTNNTDAQPLGYWTSTLNSSRSIDAWDVYFLGFLDKDAVHRTTSCGVRPVITILKSVIA